MRGLIGLMVVLASGPAWARDLAVGPGQEFATVDGAIAGAVSGDRVLLAPGTWKISQVALPQALTIQGRTPGETTLTGKGTVAVLRLPAGGDLTLRGLTLDGESLRRSVDAASGGTLHMDRVRFMNGTARDVNGGGSLRLLDVRATFEETVFDGLGDAGNAGAGRGGHVLASGKSALVLRDVSISGGQAGQGGSIYADKAVSVLFDGGEVRGNGAKEGAGLYALGAGLDFRGVDFEDNVADLGGHLSVISGYLQVRDSTFTNGSGLNGGAIWSEQAYGVVIADSAFYGEGDVVVAAVAGQKAQARLDEPAPLAGGLYVAVRNRFCPAALQRSVVFTGPDEGTFFYNNLMVDGVGAIASLDPMLMVGGSRGNVYQNTLLGQGDRVLMQVSPGSKSTVLRNSVLVGAGAGGALRSDGYPVQGTSNLFFDNVVDSDVVQGLEASVLADPRLSGWPGVVDCEWQSYVPSYDSPLVDQGGPFSFAKGSEPVQIYPDARYGAFYKEHVVVGPQKALANVLAQYADVDGSKPDLGALGGQVASALLAVDSDGDGQADFIDCDPANSAVGSGFYDACDGVDNDCDGQVDEDAATKWYTDLDGDGFGAVQSVTCAPVAGSVLDGTDCNDADPTVYPGALDRCDGVDRGCDGQGLQLAYTLYRDVDGDGFGDPNQTVFSTCPVAGYVLNGQDCAVNDPTWPRFSYLDVDLDGTGAALVGYPSCADLVLAGLGGDYALVVVPGDCDDALASVAPGKGEACDGLDNSCDGQVDEGLGSVDWFADRDADGVGEGAAVSACSAEAAFPNGLAVKDEGDCDGLEALVSPLRPELCNGIDDNCDGTADLDAPGALPFYADLDSDGLQGEYVFCVAPGAPYQATLTTAEDCDDADLLVGAGSDLYYDVDGDGQAGTFYEDSPACPVDNRPESPGYDPSLPPYSLVTEGEDCDDGDAASYVGGSELCDGADNDCNGQVDDVGAGLGSPYCVDLDRDGFGDAASTPVYACSAPSGFVGNCDDCDDGSVSVGPRKVWPDADGDGFGNPAIGAQVLASCPAAPSGTAGNDLDCDDSSASVGQATVYYADLDGDGYGNPGFLLGRYCDGSLPGGSTVYALNALDCNDFDNQVRPGFPERCNALDDDCDGQIDEGFPRIAWYFDYDNDAFGGELAGFYCEAWAAAGGYSDLGGDCDDGDAVVLGDVWYLDADGDGVGDVLAPLGQCGGVQPEGYVASSGDCDDADPDVLPGAAEGCNGVDDDCDGLVDEGIVKVPTYADVDGDGFGDPGDAVAACDLFAGRVYQGGDCNDGEPSIYPGAPEVCGDGIDQDCDAQRRDLACLSAQDADGDGFCPAASCQNGLKPGDCDDQSAGVNPWAIETCNGVDDDCDGLPDDGLSHDEDGDGHTSAGSCTGSKLDCNDFVAAIRPGAQEKCNGLDDNCDGQVDEGLRVDLDGDGSFAVSACTSASQADCDDGDPTVGFGFAELPGTGVDEDCDGLVDEDETRMDNDNDGYCESSVSCDDGALPGDCDDADPARSPNSLEVPNGIDDNCDGLPDNFFAGDLDGDGYCAAAACNPGLLPGDCNDFDAETHPGVSERCNGRDDDCDGRVPAEEYDLDFDGWRVCQGDCDDNNVRVRPYLAEDCSDGLDNDCDGSIDQDSDNDLDGVTTCTGDCRDTEDQVLPGVSEVCNLIDDDCDGQADEGYDLDGDGAVACSLCNPDPTRCDCDDLNALVKPGLPEICDDGFDNDCDGSIDVSNDADNDGWETCEGDCWDDNPRVNPGFPELCNGVDDDCDGEIDEDFDRDGDGFLGVCGNDCDDNAADVNPAQVERCNGVDDDCDGIVPADEVDADGDGYLACEDCSDDDGRVWLACETCKDADGDGALVGCDDNLGAPDDCDDEDGARSPAFAEICGSGVDEDCDGLADWEDSDCDVAEVLPARWFCGCASGGSGNGGGVLLLGVVLLLGRRRRGGA